MKDDEMLRCPKGYETATEFFDAGEGVNAGICCGCGMARDDHTADAGPHRHAERATLGVALAIYRADDGTDHAFRLFGADQPSSDYCAAAEVAMTWFRKTSIERAQDAADLELGRRVRLEGRRIIAEVVVENSDVLNEIAVADAILAALGVPSSPPPPPA